jgi:hypothetical protein
MSDFGLAHIKKEGAFAHPDDPSHGYWGDDRQEYLARLAGYARDNNLNFDHELMNCRLSSQIMKSEKPNE